MKTSKKTSRKRTAQRRCAVASGSPLWSDRNKKPRRKGWYITRTTDGFVSWRAWGNGAWWKQLGNDGGWMTAYDGDGTQKLYEWQPESRQSIDLNASELPDLANSEASNGGPPAK